MKRLFWFLILCVLLLSACAPQSAPQSTSPTEELSESREEPLIRGEGGTSLSRSRVYRDLVPRAVDSASPVLPQIKPQKGEDYLSLKGQDAPDMLQRFGLPYDAGETWMRVRYVTAEGHDAIVLMSGRSMEKGGRILEVTLNTRDEARRLTKQYYPELTASESVWVLRKTGFQGSVLEEKKQTLTTVKAWVEACGLPFSLPAEDGVFLWYYLTNDAGTVELRVKEEKGELILQSWEMKERSASAEEQEEQGLISQEKTAAFLAQHYVYFPYERIPVAAPAADYESMRDELTTLDEMLRRFGAPYDRAGKDPEGTFTCRYFSDGGDDVRITLEEYGGVYEVTKVQVLGRSKTEELIRQSLGEIPLAKESPSVNRLYESPQKPSVKEVFAASGAPYLEYYVLNHFGSSGNTYHAYLILEDGREQPVVFHESENGIWI